MSNKIHLSWNEYLKLIDKLCEKIKKSGIYFTAIIGIPRGGMIPAVILSHKLEMECVSYIPKNGTVLLVDEIIDTGNTLKEKFKSFSISNAKIYTATIFKNKKCKIKPNFYVEEVKNWVVFPYETK